MTPARYVVGASIIAALAILLGYLALDAIATQGGRMLAPTEGVWQ